MIPIRSWHAASGRMHQVLGRCFHQRSGGLRQIEDVCRRYARERLAPIAAKLDEDGVFPAEPVRELAALGLLDITVPRQDGGAGMDALALSVAVEEISAGCASTGAIISIYNCLYSNLLARHGDRQQKEAFLHPYPTSGKLGCFALSEPDAGSDVAALQTTALEHGDAFILNVPLSTEGVTLGKPEEKLGIRAAPCCSLHLDDVRVPRANVLGKVGEGFKIAMTQLELARIGIASQALGISSAALYAAVEYSFTRVAFKQQLNEFQAVKLRIADMALQLESARLLVHRAAAFYEQGRASKECSMAKTAASTAATAITHHAIQILGGMGYVRQMPVERHFRDARVTEIYGGVTDIQKLIIADCVLDEHRRNKH